MYSKKYIAIALLCLALLSGAGNAAASNRSSLTYINSLNEPIVAFEALYDTPYGDQRNNSTTATILPGREFRAGIQGVTLPVSITIFLNLASYHFTDLSGLNPEQDMQLEIFYENGAPCIKRVDNGEGLVISGVERKYLTPQNRPNAVNRDSLTDCKTLEEVEQLVVETTEGALASLGELRSFEIEAGPIADQEQANVRCPEVVGEWNAEHEATATWNGNWLTTTPGKMSVCSATVGAAPLSEALFKEGENEELSLYYPVFWQDWAGFGVSKRMSLSDPEDGIATIITLPIPKTDAPEMLDDILSDLRVDSYRPVAFNLSATDANFEKDLTFIEGTRDKYDDYDIVMEALTAAIENGTLMEARINYIQDTFFDERRAGNEGTPSPGVVVMISGEQLKALFMPKGDRLIP